MNKAQKANEYIQTILAVLDKGVIVAHSVGEQFLDSVGHTKDSRQFTNRPNLDMIANLAYKPYSDSGTLATLKEIGVPAEILEIQKQRFEKEHDIEEKQRLAIAVEHVKMVIEHGIGKRSINYWHTTSRSL